MINRLAVWPIVFALRIKCGFMGLMLKIAQDQTKDADKEGLPLEVFKLREQTVNTEINNLLGRIEALRGKK